MICIVIFPVDSSVRVCVCIRLKTYRKKQQQQQQWRRRWRWKICFVFLKQYLMDVWAKRTHTYEKKNIQSERIINKKLSILYWRNKFSFILSVYTQTHTYTSFNGEGYTESFFTHKFSLSFYLSFSSFISLYVDFIFYHS